MHIDPYRPGEYLVVALNDVMADAGITGLTVRRIAAAMNMKASTMAAQYGRREDVLQTGAHEMCMARSRWLGGRVAHRGPVGFLPDDDDVESVRAWLGWLELWRTEPSLQAVLREGRDDELAILADSVGHVADRETLRGLLAFLDGLYVALTEPVTPLRPSTAVVLLEQYLVLLGLSHRDRDGPN